MYKGGHVQEFVMMSFHPRTRFHPQGEPTRAAAGSGATGPRVKRGSFPKCPVDNGAPDPLAASTFWLDEIDGK